MPINTTRNEKIIGNLGNFQANNQKKIEEKKNYNRYLAFNIP